MWMNEWDIEEAVHRFDRAATPNLGRGAIILQRLMRWTNRNSDGWPYWRLPSNAARSLMNLLQSVDRFGPVDDVSDADLKKALAPIKAFLTRRGVSHEAIFAYSDQRML